MGGTFLGVGLWLGISVIGVVMFRLGVAVGRRGAWERGYVLGRNARSVGPLRESTDLSRPPHRHVRPPQPRRVG